MLPPARRHTFVERWHGTAWETPPHSVAFTVPNDPRAAELIKSAGCVPCVYWAHHGTT